MRKVSMLVGLSLVALAATARAQEAAPTAATAAPPATNVATAPEPAATQPAAPPRRIQVGLSLLALGVGSLTASPGGMMTTQDTIFTGGLGLSLGYTLIPGLTVGIAPQVIFEVQPKVGNEPASRQYDLMARVAYAFPVVETIAIYVEVLPGYSFIVPPDGEMPKGLVLGFGGGAAMDLTDRISVNLGVGYQIGFQKVSLDDRVSDAKTSYLRVALGVGTKF